MAGGYTRSDIVKLVLENETKSFPDKCKNIEAFINREVQRIIFNNKRKK